MRNTTFTRSLLILAILLLSNSVITKANVNLTGFTITDYYTNGNFNVPNVNTKTPFRFNVTLNRQLLSNGQYEDGTSTVTLVYSNCGLCGTYTPVSSTKQVTNANFVQGATTWPYGYANLMLTAELPANIQTGFFMIKLTKYDTINKKNVTEYVATNRVNITSAGQSPSQPTGEIFDLVTYPARRQSEELIVYDYTEGYESRPLGIKLPNEQLELRWTSSKLTSSEVYISLYDERSSQAITKIKVTNSGNYSLSFSSLPVGFYNYRYYVVIEELSGLRLGRSCMFRLINDHPGLSDSYHPNAFTNSAWIFRPDSSGSPSEGYISTDWFPNWITGANVTIDLYNDNGTLYRRLVNSTPNNGHYELRDNSIRRENQAFYQFKITSVENPSQYGYSEVFHHWYD
jgi:hypothetical protein